jgi:two-component system sensor histidine kinase KdpD
MSSLKLVPYLGSILGVALVVFLFKIPKVNVNLTTIGFTFLIVVLICATAWGLGPGVLASFLGMLAFNFFFIPPINQFTIEDPQNWVALFAFLVTAITTSRLSALARSRALEEERRSKEISSLYELSFRIILNTKFDELIPSLPRQIKEIFDVAHCEILVADENEAPHPFKSYGFVQDRSHTSNANLIHLQEVMTSGRSKLIYHDHSQDQADIYVPLRLGFKIIGVLLLSQAKERMETLEAIANLVAMVIERKRVLEQVSHTEALKRNEELKSALLDSVTHSLKTPLTSIKASVTSLLDQDLPLNGNDRYELLSIINEDTDQLNHLVQNLVEMAKIDAGELHLTKTSKSLEDIIKNAVRSYRSHNIETDVPSNLPAIVVDPLLIGEVIANLVDNAIKYSPTASTIEIKAVQKGPEIITSITDHGRGIPAGEEEAIFDKFYRARSTSDRTVSGMGMGLAICRGIVQAHGGRIWVESTLGKGSTFSFALPMQRIQKEARH